MESPSVHSSLPVLTRVLLVEDDPAMLLAFRSLIESESDMEVVGEASSGTEAITAVQNLAPDLVLLDVELPDKNGIDVVREVGIDRFPTVIFVTGHEEYALEAFQVNALDYLVKPFTDQRFRATLDRVRRHLKRDRFQEISERLATLLADVQAAKNYPQRLWIRSRGQVVVLNIDEIAWIEAAAKYCLVHTNGGVHRLRESISRIEARLDPARFPRVHRSAIVNLDHVTEVISSAGSMSAMLKDGTRIPMSRSLKLRVFELAGEEA